MPEVKGVRGVGEDEFGAVGQLGVGFGGVGEEVFFAAHFGTFIEDGWRGPFAPRGGGGAGHDLGRESTVGVNEDVLGGLREAGDGAFGGKLVGETGAVVKVIGPPVMRIIAPGCEVGDGIKRGAGEDEMAVAGGGAGIFVSAVNVEVIAGHEGGGAEGDLAVGGEAGARKFLPGDMPLQGRGEGIGDEAEPFAGLAEAEDTAGAGFFDLGEEQVKLIVLAGGGLGPEPAEAVGGGEKGGRFAVGVVANDELDFCISADAVLKGEGSYELFLRYRGKFDKCELLGFHAHCELRI